MILRNSWTPFIELCFAKKRLGNDLPHHSRIVFFVLFRLDSVLSFFSEVLLLAGVVPHDRKHDDSGPACQPLKYEVILVLYCDASECPLFTTPGCHCVSEERKRLHIAPPSSVSDAEISTFTVRAVPSKGLQRPTAS